jgi:Domain of unknown function (DUF5615)
MALGLYMDHNVAAAVTQGLRLRGVDVTTAYEDGSHRLADPDLLDRAGGQGRVIFTTDPDFLSEATRRQRAGIAFAGVVYAHQLRVPIGRCVTDLELLAKAAEPQELRNQVIYLPL